MELKESSIKFSITHNLGDYSNVRSEVYLSGTLEPGDGVDATVQAMRRHATRLVHDAIDAELEARDEAPYYYDGPRFDLLRFSAARIALIVPVPRDALPGLWAESAYDMARERRLEVIQQKAAHLPDGWTLIDCSDGDYSRLPALELTAEAMVEEQLPDLEYQEYDAEPDYPDDDEWED